MSYLTALTTARVGLGRRGVSLPTAAMLAFEADHAAARDAVHADFDADGVRAALATAGIDSVILSTAASDRGQFLRRPDLGRRLSARSRATLAQMPQVDVAVIVSDGLSATAANRHAADVTIALVQHLRGLRLTPVLLAGYARVGLLNEVGECLRARAAVMILGERPGLSAPDGLSVYFEVAPRAGLTDADRNCISSIRPNGLPPKVAARQAAALITEGLRRGVSGTALKVEHDHHAELPPRLT